MGMAGGNCGSACHYRHNATISPFAATGCADFLHSAFFIFFSPPSDAADYADAAVFAAFHTPFHFSRHMLLMSCPVLLSLMAYIRYYIRH